MAFRAAPFLRLSLDPQGKATRVRRILADAADIHGIGPGRGQGHRVVRVPRIVDHLNPRRRPQYLAGLVGLHWLFELDVDRLGVPDGDWHTDARGADRQVRRGEDLARLVDHLAFFAVQPVAFE